LTGILTIKQQEAKEACEKMKQAFINLNNQIITTKTDGADPLKTRFDANQPLIDSQRSKFTDLDSNSTSLKSKMDDTLQEAIDMNNVPSI
jgi:hypothetical protein